MIDLINVQESLIKMDGAVQRFLESDNPKKEDILYKEGFRDARHVCSDALGDYQSKVFSTRERPDMDRIKEEFRIFERPSARNSKAMYDYILFLEDAFLK